MNSGGFWPSSASFSIDTAGFGGAYRATEGSSRISGAIPDSRPPTTAGDGCNRTSPIERFGCFGLSDREQDRTSAIPQEDVVIRISRLGLLAVVAAAGFAAPMRAQVTRDSCFYTRDECEARARDRAREMEERLRRQADERWAREQEAKFRAEYQRERMQDQQLRMRDQQSRVRDQQERIRDQQERVRVQSFERAREIRDRELERAQEQRERALERASEIRERELERAADMRERLLDRAREQRERELERAQSLRDAAERRRDYIPPPPGVRLRSRWP
jgi:hypothetical protein